MEIKEEEKISIARACKIMSLDRSMYYYDSIKDDSEVENKLREYAEKLPARGCPEYYKRIRKEGFGWNHKRVERIYKKLRMSKRKRIKRRIPNPERTPLLQPIYPNVTWSIDFMHDSLENGRSFRTFNIIDDFNREILAIEVAYSFPSEKVVEVLKQVIEWRGRPVNIRSDNGTEFIAKAFESFCNEPRKRINHVKIQKGKPNQNAYIERFNRAYREDVLDMHIFESMDQVRDYTETFIHDFNHMHPHASLADMSPIDFLNAKTKKIV
jgi:putative transposase